MNPAHQLREFWPCFFKVVEGCLSAVEFGCGHGHNLRQTGCTIKVGVECVPEYPVNDGQVTFVIGDALVEAGKFGDHSFDLVLLIDVVEHFEKSDGLDLLKHSQRIAKQKVLLWIPEGHAPQDEHHFDPRSGYVYKPSQEHKSAWFKEDFSRLGFDVAVWDNYHVNLVTGHKDIGALFGVWEVPDVKR